MFATWTEEKFRSLYEACQGAMLEGKTVIKWNAGDTGAEKLLTINLADGNTRAAIEAEARIRWPDAGRVKTRYTRAVARFCD